MQSPFVMSSTSDPWMLYGANGYTGQLLAEEAARRGQRPVLAGRTRDRIEPLVARLGLEGRVFRLDDPESIARSISGLAAVVLCAGPFSATARQTMDACIRARVHYIDITGEIDVIEAAAERSNAAAQSGITLLPAVGFDVVPTDCLAASLVSRLPSATHLELAFRSRGGLSPGTMKTMIDRAPNGGRVRLNGRITAVPPGWKSMEVPFRAGKHLAVTIPWGDISSAYHSTGVPNIEVYAAASPRSIANLRRSRWLQPVLKLGFVREWLKRRVEKRVHGPTPEELARSRMSIWGRASDDHGQSLEATMETAGGYTFTVLSALAVVERLLRNEAPRGFATPSRAFGKDFALMIPGTDLRFEKGTMQ